MALWQQSKDLGLNSSASTSTFKSTPDSSLTEILRGGQHFLTGREMFFKQHVKALQDLDRLLEHVTEQEKKYGERLAPQSNYYC